MTLEDVKRKTAILLDEYDAEQITPDIEYKIPDLADTAQKLVAARQPIVKTVEITPEPGTVIYKMPDDFEYCLHLWSGGKETTRRWIGNFIQTASTVTVEYSAAPTTITNETGDDYVLEVSETAAQAIPYYVAGNLLLTDMVNSPNNLIQLWNQMLAQIRSVQGGGQKRVKRVW